MARYGRISSGSVGAATIRRRRIAIGAICGLAIGAFAFGAALGDGTGPPLPAERRSPAAALASLPASASSLGFAGAEAPSAVEADDPRRASSPA